MTLKYFVYVLKSVNFNKFYVGQTENIRKRINEHNSGKTRSIKAFIPYDLIYYELFDLRKDAVRREKYLKSGAGREYLKNRLHNAPVVQLDTCLPAWQGIPDFKF
jgi:putative endonuclease